MTSALEARLVVKEFVTADATVRAVDEVSFSLKPGDFVALVGPSGSGKTTLLAMLAGLLEPTSGSIIIAGQELSAMSEKERAQFRRRSIGFTFQANNLVPYLTALENVELLLRLNKELGVAQRVAIARSLINQPTLVLADEPTASLDTERAFQVVDTLATLVHEQDRAGIMVTHDLRLVEYVDWVIQLVDGHMENVVTAQDDLACLADPADCRVIPMEALGFKERNTR
jgi:putative ABC transport system ATP-binding protein